MKKTKRFSFRKFITVINGNRELRSGLIILFLMLFVAFFGPLIAPFDPLKLSFLPLQAPSSTNLLGTDGYGRDLLSLIIYGTSTSMKIGFVAAMISGIIGTIVGGVSGYFGGKVDAVLNEVMNVFLMLPTFFLILMIIAYFGSSMFNIMIVIGLTTWTGNARLMRAQAIALRERTFVKSAIAMGESKWSILVKHVIPNGIFPIIANTTMNISGAILSEAGLSFLGLGDPNVISWGQLIYHGKQFLPRSWWICTYSGLTVVITVLAFFLIGDGLNKVLSPKMAANK
ncbi:MAG: ABC transporter permease [Erysipelotrichaceae bacterium]|nr:ABC transporter permease [Erysipelotrichaceae bacterium]